MQLLVNTNSRHVIFRTRLLQHNFNHNTLLFKCINLENRINLCALYFLTDDDVMVDIGLLLVNP